jgi:plastocyanin domain-containing protein
MKVNQSTLLFLLMIAAAVLGGGALILLGGNSAAPAITAPIVDGKQILNIAVQDRGYNPSVVTVKAGTPVELTFSGKSYGCAGAIVSKDFWSGIKMVDFGKSEVISFTPQQTGRFKYSCSMGMYVGYINVV